MKVTQLERILFDPLGWIHPERVAIPPDFSQGRCRSVINEVLRVKFQLPVPDDVKSDQGITSLFIAHWSLLPHVAFLLCCQRYRAQLVGQRLYTRLPDAVRQFTLLDLFPSRSEQAEKVTCVTCLYQRMYQELAGFESQLTAPLRPCLPLLFPPAKTPILTNTTLHPVNLLTLKLAIQHVQRNVSTFSV